MPLPSQSHRSFMDSFGRGFPRQVATIIPGPSGPSRSHSEVQAMIQGSAGFFDVDTQIYEGDIVELDDPRGGRRQHRVESIEINDGGDSPSFQSLSHIKAVWSGPLSPAAVEQSGSTHIHNGPVINNHGGRMQVAWDNVQVSQTQNLTETVTTGYEQIADTMAKVIGGLQAARLEEDEHEIVLESSEDVLREVVKPEPDKRLIKRCLASIRGVLTQIEQGVATAAGEQSREWAQGSLRALASLVLPS